MMRKISTCLMLCSATLFFVSSCNKDEAAGPPKASFTVDKTSGMANETEFTFTVNKVNAGTVSLLPYGTENPSLGGIVVTFPTGQTQATVKFKYTKVGTFNAVVVSNNHTSDGKSVKNVVSDSKTITISSGKNDFLAFNIDNSVSSKIDTAAKTIKVVMPYGTDLTALRAKFTTDPFTTVFVGSVEQKSGATVNIGTTPNNFTSPVVYTVKANNGTTKAYTVTVTHFPISTYTSFKSFAGKQISAAVKDRVPPVWIDTLSHEIVIYDVYGTTADKFDSVSIQYALKNPFAVLHLGSGTGKFKSESLLNLTSSKTLKVSAQDSATISPGPIEYTLYAVAAPKLTFSTPDLAPGAIINYSDFNIEFRVLDGTDISSLEILPAITTPAGVTVTNVTANGNPVSLPATPMDIDFTSDVKFNLTVQDNNINVTYTVVYTAKVTVLK